MKKSLYDLVGVPPVAPREMIAAACKRRIAKLEANPGDEARAEIYAVREAWSILGDEKLRAGYDASLAAATGPVDAAPAAPFADIDPRTVAGELFRPRRLWGENWERYRKLVFVMLIVGLFSLSTAWNHNRRVAAQKRVEAAEYEATYGEPAPDAKKAAKAEDAKPAEPFSAEKFERELKEREAAIQDQVAKDQTAKEDEFRNKLQQDNDPYSGRRRTTRSR
jgi:curved DNA-binding protein CbpA